MIPVRSLSVSAFLLISTFSFAADPSTVLHFANGDYVAGTLTETSDPNRLGWKSPSFTTPFQFELNGISSVHFPAPAKPVQPEGNYCIEFANGDMLFGSLAGLDETQALFDVPDIGRVAIDRTIVQRICRWGNGTDQLFVGPSGLNGWQTGGEDRSWREDSGHLIADKPGAVLSRDFGIPNQARFEFELSWTTQPDFELAIGVGDDPKLAARAFKFEVWENEIVIQRETEREADVAPLQKISGKSGRLHYQAFLDQSKGRMMVFSSSGEPLADMTVQTAKPQVMGGIKLLNRNGNVRLENLRIGRWNGDPPHNAELNKTRIHSSDGKIRYGQLKAFDPETREFVTTEEGESQRIAEDLIHDIVLSQATEIPPRGVRAVFLSGMKLSGDLVKVEGNSGLMKCPGIVEPITITFDKLQSLVSMAKSAADAPQLPQRRGRLEMNGIRLHGCLVDGQGAEGRCLVWHPQFSATSSPMEPGGSGNVIYRDPPPVQPANPQPAQMQARVRAIRAVGVQANPQAEADESRTLKKGAKTSPAVLHLRTGDTIPCKVVGIDEKGVTFESSVTEATFAPSDRIQAVELMPHATSIMIETPKRNRLLTVPRMQRDNPPTHLVRSVDGDYLRGRLMALDGEQMQIELRLESKIVKRDRIVRIIWLHPELLDPAAKSVGSDNPADAHRIQAIPTSLGGSATDQNRITFVPEQIDGSILSGRSDLLGMCKVNLNEVDRLILGQAIEQAAAELAFQSWKLKPAADPLAPKEPSEGGAGDSSEGQESALVGKPAPDFSLDLLDGTKFQLSSHKDKVVILDFWASWCGPCLQAMPQIDKVAHEFSDQGVVLFAVNLEESPEKVKAALERLKLETTVVLDRNGRTAERYGATAIPQTVIIDREGKVARVFVGGGARFDEQLRTAVKAVLGK